MLEKKYLPEILKVKKKIAKKEVPFILFAFDWNPNGKVDRRRQEKIPHDDIIDFAKRIGDMTAYVELPEVNVNTVEYVMDIMLRTLYQAGGQFQKKGLEDSDLSQMETYAAVAKKRKCILM